MSKTLAKFAPAKGIAVDIPAYALGREYWSSGANMVFRPFAERAGGYDDVYGAPQAEIRALFNAQIGGLNYWLYHGKTKSYAVTGLTHTDITKGGGSLTSVSRSNQWTVGLFNGFPYANNAVDNPMYWDGNVTHDYVDLPGWLATTTCYSLRAFSNFLLALNCTTAGINLGDQVKWSAAAPAGAMPTTWTPATTNDAGGLQLSDTSGVIIDGAPLGSGFACYKARDAHILEYRPDNQVFQQRLLPIRRGVLARNCIADYRGRHFVVTSDGDVILTDGNAYESVLENRMQKFIFNQLDQASYDAVFCVPFKRRAEIWVCFPSSGNSFCDLAAIWNSKDNSWGVRELPLISCAAAGIVNDTAAAEDWNSDAGSWDSDTTIWNEQTALAAQEQLVLGQPNDAAPTSSLMLQIDKGLTANGAAINARVSKYSMDLGDPSRVKLVRGVYPHVNADPGTQLLVRVGSQMEASGPITWSSEVTYTVGSGQRVSTFAVGKYISVEFRSTAAAAWSLPAFDIEFEMRGYW